MDIPGKRRGGIWHGTGREYGATARESGWDGIMENLGKPCIPIFQAWGRRERTGTMNKRQLGVSFVGNFRLEGLDSVISCSLIPTEYPDGFWLPVFLSDLWHCLS